MSSTALDASANSASNEDEAAYLDEILTKRGKLEDAELKYRSQSANADPAVAGGKTDANAKTSVEILEKPGLSEEARHGQGDNVKGGSKAPGVEFVPNSAPGVEFVPNTAPGIEFVPNTAPGVEFVPHTKGVDEKSGANCKAKGLKIVETGKEVATESQSPSAASPSPDVESTPVTALVRQTQQHQQHHPGAYMHAPGEQMQRTSTVDFGVLQPITDVVDVDSYVPPRPEEHPTVQSASIPSGTENPQNLVEADLAQDPEDMQAADPVNLEDTNQREKEHEQQRNSFIVFVLFLLIVGGVIVGVVAGTRGGGDDDTVGSAVSAMNFSMNLSEVPSAAPTGELDELLMRLPDYTIASLNNGSETPQWKAWSWLSNHQNLTNLEYWRKRQLFVLACFFYSFGGENWYWQMRERWMDDTTDECFWFSSGYGRFIDGEYREYPPEEQEPSCNEQGEFIRLEFEGLTKDVEDSLSPSMPPELSLLTNLKLIRLNRDFFDGPFDQMFPTELFELTSLTELHLGGNRLTGTIPSEVGLFVNMKMFWFFGNKLSGTIPTELGLMTSLTELGIARNLLTGSLPRELGALTKMTRLELYRNKFSGTIPFVDYANMTELEMLWLHRSGFTGTIDTEIGLLVPVESLQIHLNELTGPIPSEVALLTNLKTLYLQENSLTGELPLELNASVAMKLWENQFTGTVPEHLCSYLWCDCTSNFTPPVSTCGATFARPRWPGIFPEDDEEEGGASNETTILFNLHTDLFPDQMQWEWNKKLLAANGTEIWETLEGSGGELQFELFLHLHTFSIEHGSSYQLVLIDTWGDGFFFNGYVSLTAPNQTELYVLGRPNRITLFSKVIVDVDVAVNGTIDVTETVLD